MFYRNTLQKNFAEWKIWWLKKLKTFWNIFQKVFDFINNLKQGDLLWFKMVTASIPVPKIFFKK